MIDRGATAAVGNPRDERFASLYRRHYGEIRDYCRRRVAPDVVDDVLSETFLTAWRRLDDLPEGDRARLWLYRVAYRTIGHQWRSASRRRRLEDRLRTGARSPTPTDVDEDADALQLQQVLEAAERLNATDAEVLRLSAWEQLGIADIAAVLDIAPNAVKQRLHRARRNLAREYRRCALQSSPAADTGGSR